MNTEVIMQDTPAVERKRVWSTLQIYLGAFITGPIGGCYFIGKNYKTFGDVSKSKKSILIGIVISILISAIFALIPESLLKKIPLQLVPISYLAVIAAYTQNCQKAQIAKCIKAGHKRHSYLKFILLLFPLLAIQLVLGFLLAFLFG